MIITRYKKPVQSYTPYRGLDLFNEFLTKFESAQQDTTQMADFHPSVNTREDDDAYYIEVDLPGVKKENVDINVEENILTISGSRELKKETKEEDYYKVESAYGTFTRSFTLPEKVDIENIKATSNNGVLEVEIPKLKVTTDTVKKIEIK